MSPTIKTLICTDIAAKALQFTHGLIQQFDNKQWCRKIRYGRLEGQVFFLWLTGVVGTPT